MSNGFNYQEAACDLTDSVLIGAFQRIRDLAKEWGTPTLQAARFGSGSPKSIQSDATLFENDPTKGHLRTFSNVNLSVEVKQVGPITITFSRTPKTLTISVSSPHDATIKFAAAAVAALHEHGLVAPRTQENTSDPQNAILRALAEQVAAMRDLINKQMHNNEDQRAKLAAEHAERSERLEKEYQERFQRVKSDHEAWEAETKRRIVEKDELLDQRGRGLDEREAKLDLQSERDARRGLRNQIQAAAKKMFENPDLSEQARASFERVAKACRWTIGGAVVLLAVALFVPPVLELGLEKVLSPEVIWLVWSMRILGGITLAAALIYYVSSLSAWSRQVSSIEMRSKQFALDIDRASWLVEMALEYEKEGKALPPAMVESFTRGLFDGGAQGHQSEPPSASLLHLIQNAESLKVGAAGAELTLTGKQIRKADAQAGKNS